MILIFAYLASNVLANMSVTFFGPISTPINAFLLIAFDLVSRDKLHERWKNKNLWVKMFLLISIGSALSWLLNKDSGRIALASLIAFSLTGLSDTISYHLLKNHTRLIKVNGSNIVSAAVDSIAFPTIAFGIFIPWVVLGQFFAKVLGGYIWSIIIFRDDKEKLSSSTSNLS